MAAWPDVLTYKNWARISDTVDDAAIEATIDAVHAAIVVRCPVLTDHDDIPPEVATAALMWCNRLMSRRNSPDGIVGTEAGITNIGRIDPDVGRLIGPYTEPVLS